MMLPARIMVTATAWLGLLLGSLPSAGADEPVAAVEVAPVGITQVLALGPLPVAVAQLDASAKADPLRRAIIEHANRGRSPRAGQAAEVFGKSLQWQAIAPGETPAPTGEAFWLWWVQLDTERFVQGHLEVDGLQQAHLFHDTRPIPGGDEGHPLVLRNGTHALWLLHQGPAADQAPSLAWRGKAEHDRIVAHTRPERRVSPERLTNAETVSSMAISPDGRYLALAFDSRSDASDLDVRRLEIRDLGENRIVRQWTANRPGAMAWSPDNRFLAIHEGNNLWLHEWPGGEARLLLANHEHLGEIRWHPDSRSIVFAWNEPFKDDNAKTRRLRALEDRWKTFRDNSQLFQVDVTSGLVRPLTAGKQSVTLHDIHPSGDRLLLSERLIDYAEPPHSLARVFELRLEPWAFTNAEGDSIDGRYYLPPDFNPGKKYPLIVYYYGGTRPVNRQFTGRYPFNLWAAQGYVIYVLQPRGTVGYGQAFSAPHVNTWGKYTADDILEGAQKFIAAHDFVDGKRVGNIGASYGGFMTMQLATLTDMYAASISHAGISALTGYWGQGW